MPSKKHKPEEIIGKLREVEIVLAQGPRLPRRAAGSGSANKPITSMDGSPFASGIETFCVDQLQTSIRRQLVGQSAQMGNPHTRTSTAGRPQEPR
jgi:hypothetical protein